MAGSSVVRDTSLSLLFFRHMTWPWISLSPELPPLFRKTSSDLRTIASVWGGNRMGAAGVVGTTRAPSLSSIPRADPIMAQPNRHANAHALELGTNSFFFSGRTDYQGLIPWAWIEASTKGAVLLFVASEAEYQARSLGANQFVGGIAGGMVGGIAQAYATMGFCTCMKTVEITKHKMAAAGVKPPSTFATFMDIYRKEGIRGINRGVNAVAIRQTTNWGSRFGLSRLAESAIRKVTGKDDSQKLSAWEKVLASGLGGGLSAWNQPIEVIRVEMQSKTQDPNRPKNLTVGKTFKYIYDSNGLKGLYRGVAPRIGLGIWQTVCMVALGDM